MNSLTTEKEKPVELPDQSPQEVPSSPPKEIPREQW